MSKEVILMADVEGLGAEGEIVRVAEGYARNYLLPRKKAAAVNAATKRLVEKMKAERIEREAAAKADAETLAAKLATVSVTISMKTGENGKLFGSVSASDVLAALAQQGITLDKKQLSMPSPLRELGVFDIPIKLTADVESKCKVWVVEE